MCKREYSQKGIATLKIKSLCKEGLCFRKEHGESNKSSINNKTEFLLDCLHFRVSILIPPLSAYWKSALSCLQLGYLLRIELNFSLLLLSSWKWFLENEYFLLLLWCKSITFFFFKCIHFSCSYNTILPKIILKPR